MKMGVLQSIVKRLSLRGLGFCQFEEMITAITRVLIEAQEA